MPKVSAKESTSPSNLEATFAALAKKHAGLKEPPKIETVSPEDIVQTPSVSVNLLCGPDQGIRKGSIVHWYGPESSLKSWFALEMCREAQKKWPEKIVAYIDTEYRVDLSLATELIGVNVEPMETGVPRFIYRRPDNAEQAWEEIGDFAASGHFSLIVLDSNSAMRSKAVAESPEFSLGQVGSAARINSAALQKYAPTIVKSGTILWAISQTRITSVQPVVTKGPTGGAAWAFYATHEFKCEKATKERGEESQELQIYAKKMKYSRSLLDCLVPVVLGHGVNVPADVLLRGVEKGVVERAGAFYKYNGTLLGQGINNACETLIDKPEIQTEILQKIYQA